MPLRKWVRGQGSVTTNPSARQHVLDPHEDLGSDQRLVLAFVEHTAVADHPHVVRITEHAVEVGSGDRSARRAGVTGRESTGSQLDTQVRQADIAAGVGLKGPGDVWGTVTVEDDRLDFTGRRTVNGQA